MTSTVATVTDARIRAAHRSVLVIFALSGIAFAAWASRIADAKADLGLSPGQLGVTLLFASAGSLIAMPSAGRIAGRIGAAKWHRTRRPQPRRGNRNRRRER